MPHSNQPIDLALHKSQHAPSVEQGRGRLVSATELPNLQARPLISNFRDLRPIMWSVGLVWVTVLAYLAFADRTRILSDFPAMLGWIILGAVVNLIPLRGWQSAPFTAD